MAVQVEDFILRPNKFEGLYKLADDVTQRQDKEYLKGQKAQANRNNLMDDLLKYANPKDYFTGTPQDPVISQGIRNVLDKGAKLITENPGLTNDMLYTLVAPDVSKLSAASQNLKQIDEQVKQSLPLLKDHKGIDQELLARKVKENAYMNPDGSLKDLSNIDPNTDWVDYTLRNSDVYNNTGFDQFAKEAKSWTDVGTTKTTTGNGAVKKFKSKLSAPNYLISEKDKEGNHLDFVPKYDVATENGVPLLHPFTNPDGSVTQAPVRLLDEGIMNDLPPDAKGYLLQEQRKYAKEHNVPVNSLQAKNFARAMAYDELNVPTKKWGTVEVVEEQKAPQIKVYNNNGKGSSAADINDIYKKIDDATNDESTGIWANDTTKKMYPKLEVKNGDRLGTRFNQLDTDAQKVIMDFVNNNRTEKYNPEEVFINKDKDGKIKVYHLNKDNQPIPTEETLIGTLPYIGTNVKVNPSVKERQTILQRAKNLITPSKKKETKSADPLGIL